MKLYTQHPKLDRGHCFSLTERELCGLSKKKKIYTTISRTTNTLDANNITEHICIIIGEFVREHPCIIVGEFVRFSFMLKIDG
jgi:hypothetical protein